MVNRLFKIVEMAVNDIKREINENREKTIKAVGRDG